MDHFQEHKNWLKEQLSCLGLMYPIQHFRYNYGLVEQSKNNPTWHRLQFFKSFVKRGDFCFDIGAHGGVITELLLLAGARVLAVEPQSKLSHILENRFRFAPVKIVRCAVGSEPGDLDIYLCNHSDMSTASTDFIQALNSSGLAEHWQASWSNKERVPVTTLPALIEQWGVPDYAKIDVEGFEFDILSVLRTPVRKLSFEFNKELLETAWRCALHLKSLANYRFNISVMDTYQFQLTDWVDIQSLNDVLQNLSQADRRGDIYAFLHS